MRSLPIWTYSFLRTYDMSLIMRKPNFTECKQGRCISVCSDVHTDLVLFLESLQSTCYFQKFKNFFILHSSLTLCTLGNFALYMYAYLSSADYYYYFLNQCIRNTIRVSNSFGSRSVSRLFAKVINTAEDSSWQRDQ